MSCSKGVTIRHVGRSSIRFNVQYDRKTCLLCVQGAAQATGRLGDEQRLGKHFIVRVSQEVENTVERADKSRTNKQKREDKKAKS